MSSGSRYGASRLQADTTERIERMRFQGSKDWYYCPADAMLPELTGLDERLQRVTIDAFGLEVLTDSRRLVDQLQQFDEFTRGHADRRRYGRLYYVTQAENHQPIPNPSGGFGLVEMSSDPADTVYDPLTGTAVINAWDRFTSMESLALGMFSYQRAREGFFGVHAALLCRDGKGYILMGKARTGKTTTALALATYGFELLSDDWVELTRTDEGYAALPATPAVALDSATFAELQQQYERYRGLDTTGFASYGKLMMPMRHFNLGWSNAEPLPIEKVLFLDNEGVLDEITVEQFLNFQRLTNPHTPFMNVPDGLSVRAAHLAPERLADGVRDIRTMKRRYNEFLAAFLRGNAGRAARFCNKNYTIDQAAREIGEQFG
jgi:hypothetical protein